MDGNVFSVGIDGTNSRTFFSSPAPAASIPEGSLTLVWNYALWHDSIWRPRDPGDGNIFSVGIDGSGFQDLYNFTGGS